MKIVFNSVFIIFSIFFYSINPSLTFGNNQNPSIAIPTIGLQIAYEKKTFNHPQYGIQNLEGSKVLSVQPNSLAAISGLKKGDLITGIGYFSPKNPEEFVRFLKESFKKGDTVKITTIKPNSSGDLTVNSYSFILPAQIKNNRIIPSNQNLIKEKKQIAKSPPLKKERSKVSKNNNEIKQQPTATLSPKVESYIYLEDLDLYAGIEVRNLTPLEENHLGNLAWADKTEPIGPNNFYRKISEKHSIALRNKSLKGVRVVSIEPHGPTEHKVRRKMRVKTGDVIVGAMPSNGQPISNTHHFRISLEHQIKYPSKVSRNNFAGFPVVRESGAGKLDYEWISIAMEAPSETIKRVKSLANKGDSRAQYQLGEIYRTGKLFNPIKNFEAFLWYKKAAKNGEKKAKKILHNYADEADFFRQAALELNPEAPLKLAEMYFQGKGVEKDFEKAAQYYEGASLKGNAEAQLKLGNLYVKGLGVEKDYAKAEHWYKKAVKQGNVEASAALNKLWLLVKVDPQKVLLGMELEQVSDQILRVVHIKKNGVSFLAGLRTEDRITSIDWAADSKSMLEVLRNLKISQIAHIKTQRGWFDVQSPSVTNVVGDIKNYSRIPYKPGPSDFSYTLIPIAKTFKEDEDKTADSKNDIEEMAVDVNLCDRLASHPDDETKPKTVSGTREDKITPQAIEACIDAVKSNPGELRFRFQLARSLLAAKLYEEALKILKGLSNKNHGPSQYYLAELFSEGKGLQKDEKRAEELYQKAISNKFYPRKEADGTIFYRGEFFWPGVLIRIYYFGLGPLDIPDMMYDYKEWMVRLRERRYISNFAEALQELCNNPFSEDQMQRFNYVPMPKVDEMTFITGGYSHAIQLNEELHDPIRVAKPAIKDASKLIEKFSCNSPTFKRVKNNMEIYHKKVFEEHSLDIKKINRD